MIVVDVSIVACYFIESEKTALAGDLMHRDPNWRMNDKALLDPVMLDLRTASAQR